MTLLAAHDVHKTYRLGKVRVPVLRGVSMEVREGEFVAILGASGSGKSTLLHLLGGLDRPDPAPARPPAGDRAPGQIVFRGRPLAELGAAGLDRYRAGSVGFIFQFYHLLPELTVLQNVVIAGMIRHGPLGYFRSGAGVERRAGALLAAFGLSHRLRHRPAELSGGERQRVAIARALINDPPLLLADEPTGNLDHTTGGVILDAILKEAATAKRTLVVVTHDHEVAARADRVVRLTDGTIESLN